MQRCSYPGCNHMAEVILNRHTLAEHGMKKSDVIKKYGTFTVRFQVLDKRINQWLREVAPSITHDSFRRPQILSVK
jgi:hypothetical protein